MENELSRKNIGDVSEQGYTFVITEYQRGYRWTEKQVKQLLNDLNDYFDLEHDGKNDKGGSYYLQPIVLKDHDTAGGKLEVIDGQQRLTTLLLIYSVIMSWRPRVTLPYQIEYTKLKETVSGRIDVKSIGIEKLCEIVMESPNPDLTLFLQLILRANKEGYLKKIPIKLYEKFIDYYHIYKAAECIEEWLASWGENQSDNMVSRLKDKLDSRVELIWYKVNEKITAEHVFTRLNDGKIVLTNSELIKAIFLNTANFSEAENTALFIQMMQYRIASEWDSIEQELQDDEVWYFLTGEKNSYETRIDLIFSLLADEMSGSKRLGSLEHSLYSYEVFNRVFMTAQADRILNSDYVLEQWDKVTECMMLFKEWFKNDQLYHRIGYLITTARDKRRMLQEIVKQRYLDKIEFLTYLDKRIKEKFSNIEFSEVDYENTSPERLRDILLLFNIVTILQSKGNGNRFSFDKYIIHSWDIEHIRASADNPPKDKKMHRNLIENMLLTLQFIKPDKKTNKEIKVVTSQLEEWKKDNEDKQDKNFNVPYKELQEVYKTVLKLAGEDEPHGGLWNLTLLDSKTNRGYKNWTFAAKRNFLLQREQEGQFIPICTKNVFTKNYSKNVTELMRWSQEDAEAYEEEFLKVMEPYSMGEGEADV